METIQQTVQTESFHGAGKTDWPLLAFWVTYFGSIAGVVIAVF